MKKSILGGECQILKTKFTDKSDISHRALYIDINETDALTSNRKPFVGN